MKNTFKLSALAIILALLAACNPGKKAASPADSVATTVKVDSNAKTTTIPDTTRKDTAKM